MTTSPRRERLHLVLMLILTFSTGVVDAVGYLGFDRVFTGNMTGNVVILGMGLAGAEELPVLRPLLALGLFLVGALLGGRLSTHEVGWTRRTTLAFGLAALSLTLLAVVMATMDAADSGPVGTVTTSTLALTMGLQAATARRLGVTDVSTVVVTSTITGLAADSRLAGGQGPRSGRRALAVLLILLGALTGALLLRIDPWVGVALSATLCLVVTCAGHRDSRREVPVAATQPA